MSLQLVLLIQSSVKLREGIPYRTWLQLSPSPSARYEAIKAPLLNFTIDKEDGEKLSMSLKKKIYSFSSNNVELIAELYPQSNSTRITTNGPLPFSFWVNGPRQNACLTIYIQNAKIFKSSKQFLLATSIEYFFAKIKIWQIQEKNYVQILHQLWHGGEVLRALWWVIRFLTIE